MDGTTAIAIVAAILAALAPIIAAVVLWIQSKANFTAIEKSKEETLTQVQKLHVIVNSRLSELLVLTAASARAKGKLEGEGKEPDDKISRVHVEVPKTIVEALTPVDEPKAGT